MSQIYPLFASPLIVNIINLNTYKLEKDIKSFDKIEFEKIGSEGGCQITTNRRILKEYPKLKNSILNEFKKTIKDNFKYDNDFMITTSWVVKTPFEAYGQSHCHKNSFYSGIYYFGEYPKDCGNLEIESPILHHTYFLILPTEYDFNTSTNYTVYPQSNLLIFFPSYLRHRITKNKNQSTRYSLAFNIVPLGEYGNVDSTYNTSWT